MIQYNVFPNGKRYCATFSYDDGCENDVRLVDLFNRYGIKGTFHLNGRNYDGLEDEALRKVAELYRGHEISCHTYSHCYPTLMPAPSVIREIMEDRRILERIAGYPMMGISYPYGSCSEAVSQTLMCCGMRYGRTTVATHNFSMPHDFMMWHPTSHHKEAVPMTKEFLRRVNGNMIYPILYIWGHSSEFQTEEQWAEFESVLKQLSENSNIWFATNRDIVLYTHAQRNLNISVDEKIFYNPSSIPVWVEKDNHQIIEISPGGTVALK